MLISKSNDCPKCGPGHENACFVTYHNGWHCFSCGASHIIDEDNYSFKGIKAQSRTIYIPDNITFNPDKFSLNVLNWLYKYGIYKSDIRKYNIGFVSTETFVSKSGLEFSGESLIFPIIVNAEIVYYQRRFFPDKKILTVGNKDTIFVTNNDIISDTIILVEDYISSIRIGNITPSICLFGTNLKKNILDYILNYYTNIFIWLDGDEPGQNGAKKIFDKLCATIRYECKLNAFKIKCYNIKIIRTDNDPKTYSNTEIQNIITTNSINF